MKQEYFVVVLAHSLRGRLRRVQVPHTAIYSVLILALLGCFSLFGFVASYARMALKVANYNALRRETDGLRAGYQNLLNKVNQKDRQLATLQIYAREVSMAYGIKQTLEGPSGISHEGRLIPTFTESVSDYDYLRRVRALDLPSKASHRLSPLNGLPSIWPVEGRFMSPFGKRTDPFSGEGAFHRGVDISAPTGTTVHVTGDGVVVFAGLDSGFGRLVIVDHGSGTQTWYAHLSAFYIHVGQDVRKGDGVGAVGSSGRTTAPHLHYEVHLGGNAVNPYTYLERAKIFQAPAKTDLF